MNTTFYNTQDTLSFIAKRHGSSVLLGKRLKAYFPDYAPQLSKNKKNLVYAVYDNGAATILYDNINSGQSDKNIAIRQAVSVLTEAYIERKAAERIIREFAEALGWKVNSPAQKLRAAPKPRYRYSSIPFHGSYRVVRRHRQKIMTANKTSTVKAGAGKANAIFSGNILQTKKQIVRFGAYNWRVLDVQADKALLLCEDIIEKRPYNARYTDVTWEECSLRRYLNGEFFRKFSIPEQKFILKSNNVNANNRWYAIKGGDDTLDKVFLLSVEETVKYFGDSGRLVHWEPGDLGYISDKHNNERTARYGGETCWWWLRSPGSHGYNAANVSKSGHLIVNGNYVDNWDGGVRPAIWLNLNVRPFTVYRGK